jgi:hypothetical protein
MRLPRIPYSSAWHPYWAMSPVNRRGTGWRWERKSVRSASRARTQDLASFLSVLYAAVERYGAPEACLSPSLRRAPSS